ncbi:MAG: alpha/beta hydrolase [Gemmatimonadaceae bacterium]
MMSNVIDAIPSGPSRPSRLRRTLRAIVKWALIVVATVLVITTIAGRVLHARDDARWKAPGRLVDIGGRRLHLLCAGTGSPTIILEAGLGEFSVPAWHSVQPQLATITRTCSYDRAGQGWSDPAPGPQLATAMVEDLHTLLANAGERPPYVMVGHSAGGPLVRHFTVHHRDEVVGLVLLDGSHENQKKLEPIPTWVGWMVHVLPVANALGLDRVAAALGPSDSLTAMTAARTTSAATVSSLVDFWSVFDAWLDQVGADARPFGDLPLDVLTAGIHTPDPGQSPEESERAKQRWFDMQKDIASRSTRGHWAIAERSSHHIQNDQPELVVATIRAQVEEVRAGHSAPSANR